MIAVVFALLLPLPRLAGLVGLVLLVALLTIGATILPAVLAGDDPARASGGWPSSWARWRWRAPRW